MKKLKVLILLIIICTLSVSAISGASAQPTRPNVETIKLFLQQHPLVIQTNTQILDVTIQGEALIINLSASFLPDGSYDAALFQQLEQDMDHALQVTQFYMLTFKIEGLSLEAWGRPLPELPSPEPGPLQREAILTGPLSGFRIALNPGHGRYWSDIYEDWRWQRVLFYDIREDLVNAEIMRLVTWGLTNHGATVIDVREQDPVARIGESGLQAWQEAAREFAIYNGLPEAIWNGGISNPSTYYDDIMARPYTANYYDADLMISLHNNGYNGTLTGTETYYDISGDYTNPAQNLLLAQAVHNSIIATIRNKYDSNWVNRGIKASDAGYGEIHYTAMPSILLELAFMDRQVPDNTYLKDQRFRVFVAEAIVDGICNYLGASCGDIPISSPTIIETPTLFPAPTAELCESQWLTFTNQRSQMAALTTNVTSVQNGTRSATWQGAIPYDGYYRLQAFIPAHAPIDWPCSRMVIAESTSNAHYQVTHAYGTSGTTVDQSLSSDEWSDLGVFYFHKAGGFQVRLLNATGEAENSRLVMASAIKVQLVGMNPPQFVYYFPLTLK